MQLSVQQIRILNVKQNSLLRVTSHKKIDWWKNYFYWTKFNFKKIDFFVFWTYVYIPYLLVYITYIFFQNYHHYTWNISKNNMELYTFIHYVTEYNTYILQQNYMNTNIVSKMSEVIALSHCSSLLWTKCRVIIHFCVFCQNEREINMLN